MSYCRVAPSLGALEGTPEEAWGTKPYTWLKHRQDPTVFFGLYDLRDYLALALHTGKKWVLWAGSDLRNLNSGFIFNDGKLKWLSEVFGSGNWILPILKSAEHWVENEAEARVLQRFGIQAKVCPSFMGKIENYDVESVPGNKVYVSSGANRQREYGFDIIESIAYKLPQIEFHLYGAPWETNHKNIIVHDLVPKDIMNDEIKKMQCGLRLNHTDGFSEVTAKSILWGQYPITRITSPFISSFVTTDELVELLEKVPHFVRPNTIAREYYRSELNNYPWTV